MYKIYSKDNCTYCTAAKSLLGSKNIPFVEYKIGKDVTKSLAIEEETAFAKLRNSGASMVSETIYAKVMVLPSVYAKIGAGAGYIPSTAAHAFEYVAGVGTTSIKPVDLGITVVNANGVGIHNQLLLTAGIKID